TKFGSEKGKVQKPARIPPQTPPAGGKKAEAGQFHSPRKIVCPAESKLVFRIFVKKCSNFVQKTPPKITVNGIRVSNTKTTASINSLEHIPSLSLTGKPFHVYCRSSFWRFTNLVH
ncbi:MAG: hypothetical protein V1846_02730, partial [Candidatus Komeilibacteria bacterium]